MAIGVAASSSGYGDRGSPASHGGGGSASSEKEREYSVTEYRKKYTDFLNSKTAELEEQRQARHYYHGDQLTAGQLKTLKDRGQPATIRDKISRKINGVIGLLERLRQDPKAYARNPEHEQGAEVATAVIRYILDANNWAALSSNESRNGAVNGIFGLELDLITGDHEDSDIGLNEVDNEHFFYDPRSYRHDFSDARYMGVAKWIHVDTAKAMFPNKEEEIDSLVTRGPGAETWQNRDRELKWTDSNEKRIFLIEHWEIQEGEWHCCFYCADTKLMSVASPFYDDKGKTTARYIMGSVNVDHDGDRYGFIRQLRSLVDELNALVSKRAHLIAMRRIIATKGAVDDVDTARKEAVRADGYLEINRLGDRDRFEFDDQARLANIAHINEAIAEVKTEIENFGPNPALIGQGIENKSGRAIALLQQAGTAELGPALINNKDWKIRVYRACWTLAQRNWTADRWIRVTDGEGVPDFKQLNGVQRAPETGQPLLDEYGQPIMVNVLGSLDVDIIIDEGPDTLNVQQDTFETLQALAQNGAMVPPKVLIMASNLPSSEKQKILQEMEQAQQPKPMDMEMMGAKLEGQKAGNRETQAKADKLKVEAAQIAGEAGLPLPGPPSPPGGPGGIGMPPTPEMGAGQPVGPGVAPMEAPGPPLAAGQGPAPPMGGGMGPFPAPGTVPPAPPGPPPAPVDPVADAKAMQSRAAAIRDSAEATKTLAEVKQMQQQAQMQTDMQQRQMASEEQAQARAEEREDTILIKMTEVMAKQQEETARLTAVIAQMAQSLAAPKRIVRDGEGRPVGVEPMTNGAGNAADSR